MTARPLAFVSAVELHLPPGGEQDFGQAHALGLADPQARERDGYEALTVADRPAPDLAAEAGGKALAAAGVEPSRLGLLFHAWIYHQGHDFWSPAHYVAREIGALGATAIGVQQMCNGGAGALELAVQALAADARLDHVLVTTADRFAAPGFDRWRGDYGVCYGDGATAVVLGRRSGGYALLGARSTSAPELEQMHRGDDPFSLAAGSADTIDVRRTKKAYLTRYGSDAFALSCALAVRRVMQAALDQAGVNGADIDVVALPRLGLSVLEAAYLPVVREVLDRARVVVLGRRTGHLGAGDAAANLAELPKGADLAPGTLAALISGGAGFSWSCLILRVEDDALD